MVLCGDGGGLDGSGGVRSVSFSFLLLPFSCLGLHCLVHLGHLAFLVPFLVS